MSSESLSTYQGKRGNSELLSDAELQQDPDEVFDLLDKLGEGSYGSVYRAIHKRSGLQVALKLIMLDGGGEQSLQEISIMHGIASPYILQFHGSYTKDRTLWIVLDYCAAGSIADIMKLNKRTLTEAEIATTCRFVLEGLAYLHRNSLIHRDIKAGNILVNEDCEAKLGDFGVAGQLSDSVTKRNTVIGTPFWMAPELLQEGGYGVNADIWSLGITCIEMAEGHPPYHNIHPMRAIFMIPSKPPPRLEHESKFSAPFVRFIERCLVKDPMQRPSAQTLLQDEFIANAPHHSHLQSLVDHTRDLIARGLLFHDVDQDSEYEQDNHSTLEYKNSDKLDPESPHVSPAFPPPEETVTPKTNVLKAFKTTTENPHPLENLLTSLNAHELKQLLFLLEINHQREVAALRSAFDKKRAPLLFALSDKR